MQLAVLISGRGSNLEALINDQNDYQVCHVISNNFKAQGLDIAQKHGIKNTVIDWSDKPCAEQMLQELLAELNADVVVLAGFMKILSSEIVKTAGKMINIHPSLLPKYPGLHTHQKVIDNNDEWHGATVHVVNDELDAGKILAQTVIQVNQITDETELAQKLISKEHKLLTAVVGLIAKERLHWDQEQVYLDGQAQNEILIFN